MAVKEMEMINREDMLKEIEEKEIKKDRVLKG